MMGIATAKLTPDEARDLRRLLKVEQSAYEDLLQLARRQNIHLRAQAVDQLDANAAEWRTRMPAAEATRKVRENFMLEIGERLEIAREDLRMSSLARSTDGDAGIQLRKTLRAWEHTAGELMRQNSLNGMLARFCLDLVGEEADILCRGMTGNNGCYDATGGEHKGACAGVIQRQA